MKLITWSEYRSRNYAQTILDLDTTLIREEDAKRKRLAKRLETANAEISTITLANIVQRKQEKRSASLSLAKNIHGTESIYQNQRAKRSVNLIWGYPNLQTLGLLPSVLFVLKRGLNILPSPRREEAWGYAKRELRLRFVEKMVQRAVIIGN